MANYNNNNDVNDHVKVPLLPTVTFLIRWRCCLTLIGLSTARGADKIDPVRDDVFLLLVLVVANVSDVSDDVFVTDELRLMTTVQTILSELHRQGTDKLGLINNDLSLVPDTIKGCHQQEDKCRNIRK